MANTPAPLNIILSSGETYGHLNLAAALIEVIKEQAPGSSIVFVGANGRAPMEKAIPSDVAAYVLNMAPFDRRNAWKNSRLLFHISVSLIQSLQILETHAPDIAVGLGAFPSGPLICAAALKKIPTLIIEPNIYPGLTNRLLKNMVDKICISFSETVRYFPESKLILTGTPVRNSIISSAADKTHACKNFGLDPGRPVCLVTAGSSDPGPVNKTIISSLPAFARHDIQLILQTGEQQYDHVSDAIKKTGHCVVVLPFIDHMEEAYAAADIVVSRGGAVTLAELAVRGMPAIIVPSASSTEDHHISNASRFLREGASIIIKEHEIPEKLAGTIIDTIRNHQELDRMGMRVRQLATPQASRLIFDEIIKSVKN